MQDDTIRLIVIEESANDAEVILNSLRKARYPIRPRHVEDEEDLQEALTEQEWDLIISVPQIGEVGIGLSVIQVFQMVKSCKQDIPIIVLLNKFDGKSIAELLSAGIRQVVHTGHDNHLQVVVGRELQDLRIRRSRQQLEQLYKESQKHNKVLLETSQDAIAYVHDGMHIYANPSYLKIFEYNSMEDLEGLPIMDLIALEDQIKFKDFMREFMTDLKEEENEFYLEGLKSNNRKFKLKMEVNHAIYDNERCIQVVMRDQSLSEESEKYLKQIEESKRIDQLTGLLNRQHFIKLLEKSLAKAIETHSRSILLYITLDNIDSIRDLVGIGGTDPVVQNIANVLKTLCKGGALARFDECSYTLLINDKDKEYATELAEKVCKAIETVVTEIDQQSILATCSIGITVVLASAASPQSVLTDAHLACKQAAESGGNRFEIYKPVVSANDQGKIKTSDITRLIETAVEENRLSLRFQPIVSLHGENQEMYEIFLRMTDTQGNLVPSNNLFDAAEKANLSVFLDKWVLKEAIKVLSEQKKKGHHTHFFVKLSDQAIKDPDVLLNLRKLLKASQLAGEQLVIELSESTAITQIKLAKAFITQLQHMECKSALEHFGTGLNYATTLKHLPVDYVKIDSSFIKGLATNPEGQQTVQEIVKLTHELKKLAIAEAVEDANSLTILWSSEVDFAQGHYIQEPLESPDFDFSDEE